jgi:hypothetical protein
VIPLSIQTQTLFAELAERIAARDAVRSIRQLSGTFARKLVSGREYWYFKASIPGAGQREFYLGPETSALRRLIDEHRAGRADETAETTELRRLCAMLRSGGANLVDPAAARVLQALSDAGLFHAGAVLVGTYAYVVLGNVLGLRLQRAARTQDVDIASRIDPPLAIAVRPTQADAPSVLRGLEMGFLPVPALDARQPSTSFKVRGRELRVDFLTLATRSRQTRAIAIPRFNVHAQPLAMLDYLIDEPMSTVALDGGAIPVRVPDPARYALHELAVAEQRPASLQTKAAKDREQALDLLEWLEQERPGDIDRALRDARRKFPVTAARIQRAAKRLPARSPARDRIAAAKGG